MIFQHFQILPQILASEQDELPTLFEFKKKI